MKFDQAVVNFVLAAGVVGTAAAEPKAAPNRLADLLRKGAPQNLRAPQEMDPCQAQLDAAGQCLATAPSNCIDCVVAMEDQLFSGNPTPTCGEYADFMCPAFYSTCPCGTCGDELEAYIFCTQCEGVECAFPAEETEPPETVPPETVPTQPPVNMSTCTEALEIVQSCMASCEFKPF